MYCLPFLGKRPSRKCKISNRYLVKQILSEREVHQLLLLVGLPHLYQAYSRGCKHVDHLLRQEGVSHYLLSLNKKLQELEQMLHHRLLLEAHLSLLFQVKSKLHHQEVLQHLLAEDLVPHHLGLTDQEVPLVVVLLHHRHQVGDHLLL